MRFWVCVCVSFFITFMVIVYCLLSTEKEKDRVWRLVVWGAANMERCRSSCGGKNLIRIYCMNFSIKMKIVQNDNEKCKLNIDVLLKHKYPLWQRFKFIKPKLYDVFYLEVPQLKKKKNNNNCCFTPWTPFMVCFFNFKNLEHFCFVIIFIILKLIQKLISLFWPHN